MKSTEEYKAEVAQSLAIFPAKTGEELEQLRVFCAQSAEEYIDRIRDSLGGLTDFDEGSIAQAHYLVDLAEHLLRYIIVVATTREDEP